MKQWFDGRTTVSRVASGLRRLATVTAVRHFALALVMVGCAVSPLPEPPPLAPLSPEDLSADCLACDGTLGIVGVPGAAPGGSLVWTLPLDQPFAPTTTLVADDGSFEVSVPGSPGDAFRLQVRLDAATGRDARSAPLDAVAELDGSLRAQAVTECVEIELEVLFGSVPVGESASALVAVRNGCGSVISIDGATLRTPSDAFTSSVTATDVLAGAESTFEVRFTPTAPGLHEEAVFVSVATPTPERRVITLSGTGAAP